MKQLYHTLRKAWWHVMFGFTLYCIVGLFETDLQNGRLHWGLCNGQWMISESAIDVLSSGKCGAILVKSVHLLLQSYLWYLGVLNNSMKCFLSFSFQVIISAHSVFFFFFALNPVWKKGGRQASKNFHLDCNCSSWLQFLYWMLSHSQWQISLKITLLYDEIFNLPIYKRSHYPYTSVICLILLLAVTFKPI